MSELFLSYAEGDKAFVQKLDSRLQDIGWNPWIDLEGVGQTDEGQYVIQEGIVTADTFAFVISPESVSSAACLQQLDQAKQLNKRIIPILRQEAKGAPDPLPDLNWIFFREGDDFTEGLQNLTETVQTDLVWIKAHTRLTIRAAEWEHRDYNTSFVLRGDDLKEAEKLLTQHEKDPPLTQLQISYIEASQQAALRRQRMAIGAIATALIVMTILSCAALLIYQDREAKSVLASVAEAEANVAATALARADDLKATAAAQAVVAVDQAQVAQTAAAVAHDAENQAAAAQATAVAAGANAQQELRAAKQAEGTAQALQAIAQTRQAEAEQGQAEAITAQQTAQAAEYLAIEAQQTAQAGAATASAQQATAIASEATASALLGAAQAQKGAAEAALSEALRAQQKAQRAAENAQNAKATAEAVKAQAEAASAQAQATLTAVQTRQAEAEQLLEETQTTLQENQLAQMILVQSLKGTFNHYQIASNR
ncbi:MAG: toll/interleukin-1 receptor domain-containing protein, partial [Chloroflexota bacterium]